MTAQKMEKCEVCKHFSEAHKNGLCSRCVGGKMRHAYKAVVK